MPEKLSRQITTLFIHEQRVFSFVFNRLRQFIFFDRNFPDFLRCTLSEFCTIGHLNWFLLTYSSYLLTYTQYWHENWNWNGKYSQTEPKMGNFKKSYTYR